MFLILVTIVLILLSIKLNMKIYLLLLFSLIAQLSYTQSASPIGIWKTIDDETGEAKSHVKIYEENDMLYGQIVKLLLKPADSICQACTGEKKDQPVLGMLIIEDMTAYKKYWSGGKIMDPENGKYYKCKIYMENDDKIKVRGYIGIELAGRNQYWERVR